MESLWDLSGMKFVLTGGSKGIGYATCCHLLSKGAHVYFCGQGEEEVRRQAIAMAKKAKEGATANGCACDISSKQGREEFVRGIQAHFGGEIDGLINNVGCNVRASIQVKKPLSLFLINL